MELPHHLATLWEADKKRIPSRPYQRDWDFGSPYLHPSGRVWVSFRHDHWHLVEPHSQAAQYFRHRRRIYPWMDAELQRSLQRHLDDRWQELGELAPEAEAALSFAYREHEEDAEISTRWVRPESLQNLQEEVYMRTVREYMRTMSQRDRNGELPHALQFADSDTLFLTDGHHRCYAHRLLNRPIRVEVYKFPQTLTQLMGIIPIDEEEADNIDAVLADVLEEALAILREKVPA